VLPILREVIRPGAVTALLAVATLVQVAFWYVASPGPVLSGVPRSPAAALQAVAWAALLLGAIPLASWRFAGRLPAGVGFAWGDARVGATVLAAGAAVAIPALAFAARAPDLQAAYPWPGAAAGASWMAFVAWAAAYAGYYAAFEFFYRGFLLRVVAGAWGLAAGVWCQALASTLLHVGKPLSETIAAFPFAFLMAILALRTRTLLWAVLLHLTIGVATDFFALRQQGWLPLPGGWP
jgi:uncharacterized protein